MLFSFQYKNMLVRQFYFIDTVACSLSSLSLCQWNVGV